MAARRCKNCAPGVIFAAPALSFVYSSVVSETQLTVFIALAGVSLLVNLVGALFAARDFSVASARVRAGVEAARAGIASREWLTKLEAASVQAVEWTTETKMRVTGLGPRMDRAEEALDSGLGKVDFVGGGLCFVAVSAVGLTAAVVSAPFRRIVRIVSGIEAFRNILRRRNRE
jgi:hypothetical protein